nr:hypothetical protein [Tanacetum cinerariifolium]
MEIIHIQFEELIEHIAPVRISIGSAPILLTPRQICLRLVPNLVPTAPYVPPTNKDLEILFQSMFDEYLEPPSVKRPVPLAPVVQVLVVSASTPSSTIIDQDAPSTSYSPSSSEVRTSILLSSLTKGDVLEGVGASSNVTLSFMVDIKHKKLLWFWACDLRVLWLRFFFSVIIIASSSSKSSLTKGDVLEGVGVSSNVTLRVNVDRWINENLMDGGDCLEWESADHDLTRDKVETQAYVSQSCYYK